MACLLGVRRLLWVAVAMKRKRWRKRNLEFSCPKDFHSYSGVAVCLAFCRKTVCSVFRNLRKSNSASVEGLSDKQIVHRRFLSELRSGAVLPQNKLLNPHLVELEQAFSVLKARNPLMPDWMIKKVLSISLSEAVD